MPLMKAISGSDAVVSGEVPAFAPRTIAVRYPELPAVPVSSGFWLSLLTASSVGSEARGTAAGVEWPIRTAA